MSQLLPAMWLPEHDFTPGEDRSVIRATRNLPGVAGREDFRVRVTTPNSWNIIVSPGRAVIDGSLNEFTQGSYAVHSNQDRTLAVTPAHPTLIRHDVVVLHVLDAENSNEVGFGWRPEVIEGTPGLLTPPTLPPNSMPIIGLRIPAGSTAVTPASLMLSPSTFAGNMDMRKPINGPSIVAYFNQGWRTLNNGWVNEGYWDAAIPAGWEHLWCWPYDMAVEVHLDVAMWSMNINGWVQYTFGHHSVDPNTDRWWARGLTRSSSYDVATSMTHVLKLEAGRPLIVDVWLHGWCWYECAVTIKGWPITTMTHSWWYGAAQWI